MAKVVTLIINPDKKYPTWESKDGRFEGNRYFISVDEIKKFLEEHPDAKYINLKTCIAK